MPMRQTSGTPSIRRTLWIGRVKSTCPPNLLRDAFDKFGRIASIETGFAGFAFLEFEDDHSCEDAIKEMNDKLIPHVGQIHVSTASVRGYEDAIRKREEYWRSKGGTPSVVLESSRSLRSGSRSVPKRRRRDSRSRSRSGRKQRHTSASSSASSVRTKRRARSRSSSRRSARSRRRFRREKNDREKCSESSSKSLSRLPSRSRRQSSERSRRSVSRGSQRSRKSEGTVLATVTDGPAITAPVESLGPIADQSALKPVNDGSTELVPSKCVLGAQENGSAVTVAMERPPLRPPLRQPLRRPSPRRQAARAATAAATAASKAMALMKSKQTGVATRDVVASFDHRTNVGLQMIPSNGVAHATDDVPELSQADRKAALCFFDGAGAYDLLLEAASVLRASTADCLNGFPHAYEGLSQQDAADVLNVIAGFVGTGGVSIGRTQSARKRQIERSVEVRHTLTFDARGRRSFRKSIVVDGVVRSVEQVPVEAIE